jgi:endonuclease-3
MRDPGSRPHVALDQAVMKRGRCNATLDRGPSPKGVRMGMDEDQIRERAAIVLDRLRATYPDATCSLHFGNAFKLLIATILSAQCTDERVNKVTPGLFARYPAPAEFAAAPLEELEDAIRSTGFYHNKARSIKGACAVILEEFGGSVPQTMPELLRLPGVARKTANVVLGNAFGVVIGVVVDTHVGRISRRLELTSQEDAGRVETDLMSVLPQESWLDFSHQAIWHGRAICTGQRPKCGACVLASVCPSAVVSPG